MHQSKTRKACFSGFWRVGVVLSKEYDVPENAHPTGALSFESVISKILTRSIHPWSCTCASEFLQARVYIGNRSVLSNFDILQDLMSHQTLKDLLKLSQLLICLSCLLSETISATVQFLHCSDQ